MTTNKWRSTTRDGTPVRIIGPMRDEDGDYLIGYIDRNGCSRERHWSLSGKFGCEDRENRLDLMPAEAEDPYAGLKAAHARGKQIQFNVQNIRWEDLGRPSWNYPVDRYRIKPKDKPVAKIVEWTERTLPSGTWIKKRGRHVAYQMSRFDDGEIVFSDGARIPANSALVAWEQLDGSPCGTEVEEPVPLLVDNVHFGIVGGLEIKVFFKDKRKVTVRFRDESGKIVADVEEVK